MFGPWTVLRNHGDAARHLSCVCVCVVSKLRRAQVCSRRRIVISQEEEGNRPAWETDLQKRRTLLVSETGSSAVKPRYL